MVGADLLVILSDVAGLYTATRVSDPAAAPVALVEEIDDQIQAYAGKASGPLGKGGMASKLHAARKANEAGIACLVADGRHSGILPQVFDAERERRHAIPGRQRPPHPPQALDRSHAQARRQRERRPGRV